MKKILAVTITPGSAVDRIAEMYQRYNEHLGIEILPFHAKRYSEGDLKVFELMARDADLICFEYWRGAQVLTEKFPWLKDKKKVVVHHNPYDLHKYDFSDFDAVVVNNTYQAKELPGSIYIPLAVDLDFFKFNNDYDLKSKTVGMVAFRIEGKKGIREVAQACRELGYKFILVGKVSKPDYMKEIMEVNPETEFRQEVPDDELKQAYYDMSVLVCNSVDGFESGPMPVLEAMACGTPVLTRDVGHIPDLYDGGNMMVRGGATEDIEDLKDSLKEMMESGEARLKLRKNGWNTIKNWDARRLAVRYAGVFNRAMFPVKSMVSVITATYNRKEQLFKIIEALDRQTYENIELVVCDDWSEDGTESAVKNMRDQVRYPIKYVNTSRSGYNLAMARNMGAIEAEGDMLMFLDSRLCPENDAIERFVERIGSKKLWLFGEKGGGKRSFVENFSMVRRKHFIRAGMMLERVSEYGGMSQELRERFGSQGFGFAYVPEARAREIKKAQKFANKMDSIKRMKFLIWKMGYGRREEEN